ncbi:MAG: hypothetical protein CL878_01365 [Dehalococcoidia bacterium]|nr:hypothetical protein [Dehalococcoidia bacterium]
MVLHTPVALQGYVNGGTQTYDPAAKPQPTQFHGGNLTQPGKHVATYGLTYADGTEESREIRWRFEINHSGTVWGQNAFAARPEGQDEYIDFRATHSGEAWGRAQTSVVQGTGRYWVYALPNPRPAAELPSVRLAATGDTVVAIAGMTLYHGQEHPLQRQRLESFRITLAANGTAADEVALAVDLGILARRYQVRPFDPAAWTGDPLAAPSGPATDPLRGPPDALDAHVLAHFAAAVRPAPRPLPDAQTEDLAELLARRRQLLKIRTAEQNRLQRAATPRVRRRCRPVYAERVQSPPSRPAGLRLPQRAAGQQDDGTGPGLAHGREPHVRRPRGRLGRRLLGACTRIGDDLQGSAAPAGAGLETTALPFVDQRARYRVQNLLAAQAQPEEVSGAVLRQPGLRVGLTSPLGHGLWRVQRLAG